VSSAVIQVEMLDRVGLVRLRRPEAMNARNDTVMSGLRDAHRI
jgi:enoyl-CoA hydratase/carnithine racemase